MQKKSGIAILFLLALCFFSPLQVLSAHYLFSAHMVVHVLLLLCVGPLLIASFSPQKKKGNTLFLFLKHHFLLAWLAGVGVMWFWHLPIVFNGGMMMMHNNGFHLMSVIEPLSLIIAGMFFSSPIIHPNTNYRIEPLSGVVYLFTACIGCSLLGVLISFAPVNTYHHFLSMHDNTGINQIILNNWKLNPSIDQQAAGLIMWVPCCLIYVSCAMFLLVQWFHTKEDKIAYINH
ncbi:MAG: cytochrome c oxidase assembly protein [Flavisolibacter sp.]